MKYLVFVVLIFSVLGCVAPNKTFQKIPPGIWRGVLLLDRAPQMKYGDDRDIVKKFDYDAELPFNFEVVYDNDSIFHIVIHNAEERIKVTDISFGRDKSTAKDTVIINFPIYDTQIRAIYEDGVMEGDWIVNYKENYRIPFKAVHGVADRFERISKDKPVNVAGNWECTFEIGTEDEYKAVGVFEQEGDVLTGTFLTETGDYRFLAGKVIDSKLYLSAFDGAHAFMFFGKIMEDGNITGTFRSGSQYTTNWEGKRNESFTLGNAYQLTKSTGKALDFAFVNESGKMISILDDRYKNKSKIIQIMGTWCPNCMDETIFLQDYFENNPDEDFAIISIGFERYKEDQKSLEALRRFKSKMQIQHEVLYGGYYDKKEAVQKIPQLDKIMSYPTLIMTDKDNKIVHIHTGFSGPATPGYKAFVEDFKQKLEVIKQK
jgi:thiol-disulfide isomerase/thioredoxin